MARTQPRPPEVQEAGLTFAEALHLAIHGRTPAIYRHSERIAVSMARAAWRHAVFAERQLRLADVFGQVEFRPRVGGTEPSRSPYQPGEWTGD